MSRFVGVLLAFVLFGLGFPLSAAAAEEEKTIPVPAEVEEVSPATPPAEHTEAPPQAAGKGDDEVEPEGVLPSADGPKEPRTVDAIHKRISSGVIGTARWLDSFFADPRVEAESGESRVKITFSLFAEKGDNIEYDVRANVRLDLPLLEERLQLLIGGDPEEDDDFQAITGQEGVPPELAAVDDSASVSLRYFLLRTVYTHLSLRGGVRLRNGIPTLFAEPRFRHSTLLDRWLFRFTQRLLAFTDGTLQARTTLDLERQLRRDMLFRLTADGTWDKDESGYFYAVGPSLFHALTPRRALVYSWINSFVTNPSHRLETSALSVRYRQRIFRDWLFYEVAPQVSFPRDEDFDAIPGIFLRLEVLFGAYQNQ